MAFTGTAWPQLTDVIVVFDKGIASAELLSHVLVSKYADHLPLYRQRQIFLRAGVDLSRSTLSDWIGRCGVELEPLANALKEVVLQQQVLHADQAPVTIVSGSVKMTP